MSTGNPSSGKWWSSGSDFTGTDPNTAWDAVLGGTPDTWSYTDGVINSRLSSGRPYLVQVRARDRATPSNIGPRPRAWIPISSA